MMPLASFFLFGGRMTRGAQKGEGGIYGEPSSLGWLLGGVSFRSRCCWAPGRLGSRGVSSHK